MDLEEYLSEYKKNGIVVIENVFSDDEVENLRNQFHERLKEIGLDHDKILSRDEEPSDGPRIKGKAANMFYGKWKLDAFLSERVYEISKYILMNTYGTKCENFDHPFCNFTDVSPYFDRVCYRLPDSIRPEGGLELHLDRNPSDPYLFKNGGLDKWRPIQSFISLTDQYGSESGGLKAVKGFHKEIDKYFKDFVQIGGGEFCRLNSKTHCQLEKRLEPINAPKGSLVFFDNRLPHSTCSKLSGNDTREVIYFSYIPNIEINIKYCRDQFANIQKNMAPPKYIKHQDSLCDKDWEFEDLNDLQKRLLTI